MIKELGADSVMASRRLSLASTSNECATAKSLKYWSRTDGGSAKRLLPGAVSALIRSARILGRLCGAAVTAPVNSHLWSDLKLDPGLRPDTFVRFPELEGCAVRTHAYI